MNPNAAAAPPAGPARNCSLHLLHVLEHLLALLVVLAQPAHQLDRRQQVNGAPGSSQPPLEGFKATR